MLRLAFMGSPAFAVPTLAEIIAAGHEVAAVYTQPPRPGGRRGLEARATAVHAFADAHGLTVATPKSLKSAEEQAAFRALDLDVAVVVAYGLILPAEVLDAPRNGCLNLHPSLLPRWRGAAPIQRTVMAGDTETAVMVMRMDVGLDTGPVCLAEHVPVGPDQTSGELHDLLAARGADLMVRALGALKRGQLDATPQSEAGATYAAKISKAEAKIDWDRPATDVHNHIRGLSPAPGAWCGLTVDGKEERLKVLRSVVVSGEGEGEGEGEGARPGTLRGSDFTVNCGRGAVRLLRVQRQGKKTVDGADALRGFSLQVGDALNAAV